MSSNELMRKKMVEGQVLPQPLRLHLLPWAFSQVPREFFVLPSHQKLAYVEDFVPQGQGRYLMPASLQARVFDGSQVTVQDNVLLLGGGGGYSAFILSYLAESVTVLETSLDFIEKAQTFGKDNEFSSVTFVHTDDLLKGKTGFYDAIYIEGAISEIPQVLKNQLTDGGRLMAFVVSFAHGRFPHVDVIKVLRQGDSWMTTTLFPAEMPLLQTDEKKC